MPRVVHDGEGFVERYLRRHRACEGEFIPRMEIAPDSMAQVCDVCDDACEDWKPKEHDTMIKEFSHVMQILSECNYLVASEQEESVGNKPSLSEEEFAQMLVTLENVTYEFDVDKVIPVLDEFSKYSYHTRDLAKELKPVYKKVEMFDFMSAYEAVVKIKEKA